jgi:hypothetical protein
MQTHIRKVIGVSFAAAAPVIFGPNAAVAAVVALAAAHAALTSNSAAHNDANAHNGARGAHLGAAHLGAAHLDAAHLGAAHLGAFDAFEEAKEELALLHLGTDHLWGKGAPR